MAQLPAQAEPTALQRSLQPNPRDPSPAVPRGRNPGEKPKATTVEMKVTKPDGSVESQKVEADQTTGRVKSTTVQEQDVATAEESGLKPIGQIGQWAGVPPKTQGRSFTQQQTQSATGSRETPTVLPEQDYAQLQRLIARGFGGVEGHPGFPGMKRTRELVDYLKGAAEPMVQAYQHPGAHLQLGALNPIVQMFGGIAQPYTPPARQMEANLARIGNMLTQATGQMGAQEGRLMNALTRGKELQQLKDIMQTTAGATMGAGKKSGSSGGLTPAQQLMANERFDKKVERLQKKLEGSNVMFTNMGKLASMFRANEGDIPGMFVGSQFVPDVLLEEFWGAEAIEARQLATGIINALLKIQSGQAVTRAEAQKKMRELGMGPGSTAQQFRTGLIKLRDEMISSVRQKEAGFGGYGSAVAEAYRDGGGIGSEEFKAIDLGEAPSSKKKKKAKGEKPMTIDITPRDEDMSDDEFDKLLKGMQGP